MPDRPPENPAQPEHIRRPGTASSIFQPKAVLSKSGRSVRRPSLRRREGCRRPRPKQTAYHPPEARREAPCPLPRIPARQQRSGAPKRSSVPQKRRTSLPADELRIARDIGSADDRLPVLARHAAERLPPRPAIPNTVFGTTRDDRRAGFCTIRKYRHFYTPESALFRSDRGAVRHRRGRISGRGSLGKEYRYAGHCRPTASYIGPAPTRLNVPASGGGGTSEAGRIGPDDNSAGSPPADRPVPHSQAEQTLLSASVTFRDTTDVPSVLSPNTGFRRQANGAPVLRPERTKDVDPRRGHCPTRHGFDQKRRTPAVVSVRPAVRAPFQTERKKQIEAARSVSSTAVEVPSEHAYSAASCNLEWQTTKTRQANESFAAASGEPLIRGKYENCND